MSKIRNDPLLLFWSWPFWCLPFVSTFVLRVSTFPLYGLYQIGLAYALSCVDTGAPSGIGMPKRKAS